MAVTLTSGSTALTAAGAIIGCPGVSASGVAQWDAFLLTTTIAASSGITFSVNRPVKHVGNPVFNTPHGTWDYLTDYAQVFTDVAWPTASRYRMVYQAYDSSAANVCLCYAYSADGLAWTKPSLGLFTDASTSTTANNLIMASGTAAQPYYNPAGATGQKWLMVTDFIPGGSGGFNRRVYGSETVTGTYSLLSSLGDDAGKDSHALLVRAGGRYVLYYQNGSGSDSRVIGAYLSSSTDITTCTWSDQGTVISNGGGTDQRYSLRLVRQGGLISAYVLHYNSTSAQIDAVMLYASPDTDGLTFTALDTGFLPVGGGSDWDYPMLVGGAPVQVGNAWWHYYTGLDYLHNSVTPPYGGQVGIAVSGFNRIGQIAGAAGTLTTTTFTPNTPVLLLNANGTAGRIDVEVLVSGSPLSGYARSDCDGLTIDTYASEITWGSGARHLPTTVGALALKFYLTGGGIVYSYMCGTLP